MRFKVTLSEIALRDMAEVREWYAEQGVPEVGPRLVVEVVQHVKTLEEHPDLGRVVPEFGHAPIRELIHPPFRIVYRQDSIGARVVRIWRSECLLRLLSETGEPEV